MTVGAYFDAFVGNPPFAGGSSISGSLGNAYVDWLKTIHAGAHGNADLSAHFFLRANGLLGEHGTVGFIATNTIAQGDTRATGLQQLVIRDGCVIYDAVKSMAWPTGDANVSVSVIHLAKGSATSVVFDKTLEGKSVSVIDSRLRPKPERPDPVALSDNAHCAFLGSKVYGQGFTLSPNERDALIAKDPKNTERIFPYLGGEEVNTSPTQAFDRYVINFGAMSLDEARRWSDLIEIVETRVKPERDKQNRGVRKKYWWRFGEVAPALYHAIAPLKQCLVSSQVSKHLIFVFQPTNRVFSHRLNVFPLSTTSAFAVLQSRVHEPWARMLSSTLEDRLNYAASDCFATFPFPERNPRVVIDALEAAGQSLYEARDAFLSATNLGLTKTYNALKDPNRVDAAVISLRHLHESMDRAVLDAYGWSNIAVPPFCPMTDEDRTALANFDEELIDRLFALNAKRALQQVSVKRRAARGRS